MSDRHPRVSHPVFARLFDRTSRVMERDVGRYRDQLLRGLAGRVVEIGAGNGINFSHYPDTTREVLAVEPEPYLRAKAMAAARTAPVAVTVLAGVAEELPLDGASVDAAVITLVLCSLADPAEALADVHRVLRPGGELRFLEHVRSDHPRRRRFQELADRSRIWPILGGGCHSARDTVAAIERSGLCIESLQRLVIGPSWLLTNPVALGVARLPAA